jgi:hypothetical protein
MDWGVPVNDIIRSIRERQRMMQQRAAELAAEIDEADLRRREREHIVEYMNRLGRYSFALPIDQRRAMRREYMDYRQRIKNPRSREYRRAIKLVENVCGKQYADEIRKDGCMRVQCQGYCFEMMPSRTVRALDPKGQRGELCIEIMGRGSHPVDDLAVHFMHMRFTLHDWLHTACLLRGSNGFNRSLACNGPSDCQPWTGDFPKRPF